MKRFDARLLRRKIVHFSEPVKVAADMVLEIGTALEQADDAEQYDVSIKAGVPGEQRFSLVTRADFAVQQELVSRLLMRFPEARFIVEEELEEYRGVIITDANLTSYDKGMVFIIDPIDGTRQFRHQLYEWSVSVGVMRDGAHLGGVIFAPEIRGGFAVVGERGKGVFLAEKQGSCVQQAHAASWGLDGSTVYLGISLDFLAGYNSFVNSVAKEASVKSVGSCALGLAAVAAGRVGALVQSCQKPYDWAAGYPLVEEAGGKFQFYHYRNGCIVPMEKPDRASYDPGRLETAFIAGSPDAVDWLFGVLQKTWG